MGTITGTVIADRARILLQDTVVGGTRWKDPELLLWVNDAQREIVGLKPNVLTVTVDVTLVAGSKQTLPVGGTQLIDVVRNVNGMAIRRADKHIMDGENVGWHEDTASQVVRNFVFNEDAPDVFYVYPQQPTSGMSAVELQYVREPVNLSTLASTIDLKDLYLNAILDYILYRAYMKDAAEGSVTRAGAHYTAMANSLGVKVQNELSLTPNANAEGSRYRG